MRKININLFDDDVTNLNLLAAILSRRNYEVRVFNKAAICPVYGDQSDKCLNGGPCADIVIVDNQMPVMSGKEMFRQQAQRGCPIDIRNKAVVCSGKNNEGEATLEGSRCAFFSKPLQLNELFAWLDDCKNRIDLSKPSGIKRRHPRHPANIDVVYTCSNSEKLKNGTILNFSSSGLCLKASVSLMETVPIMFKTELPNGCKKASLRWIKRMGADLYLAGLMAQ